MADFEPPSFSLGIDFLFDSQANPDPQQNDVAGGQEELEFRVSDSDPEPGSVPEPARVFKRLKRGLPKLCETTPSSGCNVDDDIEDFSSQDDHFEELRPSVQYQSMCSSSKVPLSGRGGVLTKEAGPSEVKATVKSEPASTVTASTSHGENRFSKLTVSPVRKFELIESDSDYDGPLTTEGNVITGKRVKDSLESRRDEDLWKDFTPIKSFHIPTPAFDGFCEEYFQSKKGKNASEELKSDCLNNSQSIGQPWNEAASLIPAHRYFLHRDSKIRELLRDRLPNFFPLGVDDGASVIDYMGQFGNQEGPKRRATQPVFLDRSSNRGRNTMNPEQQKATESGTTKKNSRKRGNNSTGEASQSWVDPKRSKGTQRSSTARKSVKKGRNTQPQAPSSREGDWVDPRGSASVNIGLENRPSSSNGQAVGQWYTSNGRKVYVSKNGQELIGQMAYRQYKRDRGGNGKAKRKASSKKKAKS